MPNKESRKRSLAKAISWRFIAMLITMIVSFVIMKEDDQAKTAGWTAVIIGLIDSLVKIFAYYGHERVWANVEFGTKRSPDYEI